jgi:hypothetical protein
VWRLCGRCKKDLQRLCSAKRLHRVRYCFVNDLVKALLIFIRGAVNFPFSFLQNSPGDQVAARLLQLCSCHRQRGSLSGLCGRGRQENACKCGQHCLLGNVRSCDGGPVLRDRKPRLLNISPTHFRIVKKSSLLSTTGVSGAFANKLRPKMNCHGDVRIVTLLPLPQSKDCMMQFTVQSLRSLRSCCLLNALLILS